MAETNEKKVKSQLERVQEEALASLRKLGGEMLREDAVTFQGKKIMLPEGTTIRQNITFLEHVEKEEGETAQWQRIYPYRVNDGLVATMRALDKAFGSVKHDGSMGFFGPNPPRFVNIATGVNELTQVPNAGDPLSVPALPDVVLTPYFAEDPELGIVFALYAEGKKGRRYEVEGLFNLVETELRNGSIYKGKAIDAGFNFIDLSRVREDQVVYSEAVMFELDRSVWGPIEHAEALEADGIDLKGAVLLHGPFGTGKTLAAYLTGQRATAQGWTFILCDHKHDLFDALRSAKLYAPAVVFYEDVDVLTGDAEAERVQEILEAFDGIKRKGEPIRVVLTTNYPEKIHKGMVRPGRIDAAIEIGMPDAGAIRKLVQLNTPHLSREIDEEAWVKVTASMEGFLPAFVIEAVKRAHMAATIRASREGGEVHVDSDDLRLAAVSLRPQLELMQDAAETRDKDTLRSVFQNVVKPVAEQAIVDLIDPRLVKARDENGSQ